MANGRKRANHIEVIEDDDKCYVRANEKSNYFFSKFKERFAPANLTPSTIGDWGDLFCDRHTLGADELTSPFSLEEIKSATFQLGGDKAPGLDGFSMHFFQKF